MKIAVTVESDTYQYAEYGYTSDVYTAIFDSSRVTIDVILDWANRMLGYPVKLSKLTISEVVE